MVDTPSSASPIAPTKDQAQELAAEIGLAVLATLRKAAAEGRLPPDLGSLGPALAEADAAALVPRPGATPKPVPKPEKRAPGTRTIRLLIRGARDMAQAPPGTELARYRIALLVLMLCLTMLACALALGTL